MTLMYEMNEKYTIELSFMEKIKYTAKWLKQVLMILMSYFSIYIY